MAEIHVNVGPNDKSGTQIVFHNPGQHPLPPGAGQTIAQTGRKAGAEAGLKGEKEMWEEGENPYTHEKLALNNAPDGMLVDHTGQPIPYKMVPR